MKFISTFLTFFGYVLVYAAVAAGGKFATEPWAGLFADAYTESTDATVKIKPSGAGTPPFPNQAPYVPPGSKIGGHPLIPGQPGTGRTRAPAVPGGRG